MSSYTSVPRPLIAAGALIGGVALALALPMTASAHVGVTGSSTAAGSSSQLTFAVPHGCDGSATTKIAISIPEEIVAVTPTVNPNWTATKTMADLADPVKDAHGNSIVQRVSTVTYTAKTALEDGFRDTFTLGVTLPDAAGTTLAFPVVQTCEQGSTTWGDLATDGQSEHDLESPAPVLAITPAEATDEHGGHESTEAAGHNAAAESSDVVARTLGISGLAVGAIGLIVGVLAIVKRSRGAN